MILIFFYILISLGHFIFYWYFSTNSATGCKNLDSMFPCAQRLWRFVKTRWNISVVTMLMFDVVREQHFSLVWFPSDQWTASQLHLSLSDCKWDGRRQLFKGQHTGLMCGGGHLWQCGKILMDVGIIMSHPPQHPGSTGICFVSSVGLRDDKMSNCVPGSSKKKMCTIYR